MTPMRILTLIGAVAAGLWSGAGAMAQSYQATPYPYVVTTPSTGELGGSPFIGGRRSRTVTTQYYVYPAPTASTPAYRPRRHKTAAIVDVAPPRRHKSSAVGNVDSARRDRSPAVVDLQSPRRAKPYAQETQTQETQEPEEPPTAAVTPGDGKKAKDRVIRAEAEVHILGPDKMEIRLLRKALPR